MSAVAKFDELVWARMSRGLPRQKAVLAVARRHPELHRQMLAGGNRNMDPAVLAAVASGSRKLYADVPRVDPKAAVSQAKAVEAVPTKPAQVSTPAVSPAPTPTPQPAAASPARRESAELLDPWVGFNDFGAAHQIYC